LNTLPNGDGKATKFMFRFTIRDVLWLTVVVSLGCGWMLDNRTKKGELARLREDLGWADLTIEWNKVASDAASGANTRWMEAAETLQTENAQLIKDNARLKAELKDAKRADLDESGR
jgi:hypothetical protein